MAGDDDTGAQTNATKNVPVVVATTGTTTTTTTEPEVDRSVHPSGIVPTLQCVLFHTRARASLSRNALLREIGAAFEFD